jgi:general secretion pathway protein F
MPLARALGMAAGLARGGVAAALEDVRQRVARGEALHAALGRHPALFPPLYVGLVRAGERSGDLPRAFARLAAQMEREDELRARLLSASIYPLVLAVVGGAALTVLLFVVLPRFVGLLQDMNASLPRSTALLLGFSSFLQAYWPAMLLLAGGGAAAAMVALATGTGRRAGSAMLLRLPLVGTLRRHALAARFARLLAVLLGGGAPLLAALDGAAESVGDPIARDAIAAVRSRVREGVSLHAAVADRDTFPPLLAQLVAVGEESGRLQDFLLKAAEIFEERTHRLTQRLVTLAEPAMIVVFGTVVAFVALSLLQAIYSVNADVLR